MKVTRLVVEDTQAPENKNVYWLNTNDQTLNRYTKGKWVNITSKKRAVNIDDKINKAVDKILSEQLDIKVNAIIENKISNAKAESFDEITAYVGENFNKKFIPFSHINDGIVIKSPEISIDDFGYAHHRYLTDRGSWEYPDLEHSIYRSKVIVLKNESYNDDLFGNDDVITVTDNEIGTESKVYYTTETNDDATINRPIQLSSFQIGDIIVPESGYPTRVVSKITLDFYGTKTYYFMKLCN